MEARRNEPMARRTSLRVGGPADWFVIPRNVGELQVVLQKCRRAGMPFYIMGNGSNLLVSDKGYRGVIICMEAFTDVRVDGAEVWAGAGVLLSKLAAAACREGLSGLEFASGIPGSVGGAVAMNAGAYGGELRDVIRSVTAIDTKGDVRRLPNEEMGFGYRSSIIAKSGMTVIGAEFKLAYGDREKIRAVMDGLAARRREKQPLEYPSAGSAFKRPPGHFAGKLIEDAGLKGFCEGDAAVSEKHAGFIINKGNASAADIYRLMETVRGRVFESSGVMLEPEIKFLGDFM